jgi:type III pantothenate kinase
MILAVNVGNTNVRFALFEDGRIVFQHAMTCDQVPRGLDAIPFDSAGGVVVASVRDGVFEALQTFCREGGRPEPQSVPRDIPYPIAPDVRNPAQVGPDRVLNAAAALHRARGPAVAVDFGTAVTVDAAADGRFLGGAILPGVRTQTRSLHAYTSRLPDLPDPAPNRALGRDTVEAIASGVVLGVAGAVKELVATMTEETGRDFAVFLTGGDALRLGPHLPSHWHIAPDLTLWGIYHAWEKAGRP